MPPIIIDSVTRFGPEARGAVVAGGSHAGLYAATLCARAGVAAVLLNDAGFGLDQAGIGGLELLQVLGVPAAAVSHRSARIGHGGDTATRGVISALNAAAREHGLREGMTGAQALPLLAGLPPCLPPPPATESRHDLPGCIAIDSASLLMPGDAGAIALIGSHGGLLGGRPETAAKYPVFAALYNDADGGLDGAGYTRLPALEAQGIAAGTVSAWTAHIGEGLSCWQSGVVSALNPRARRLGARLGDSAQAFVAVMREARG